MNTNPTTGLIMPKCGIIIPVYNSPDHLDVLLERTSAIADQLQNWQISLLIVDDGSSPALGSESGSAAMDVAQIRHETNRGKGAALKTGFAHFLKNPEITAVLTMDADLQHPPERIPALLAAFKQGRGEVVVGCRKRDPGVMPFHRILSNAITTKIISLMIRQNVCDSQCGFRLYSRKVLEKIDLQENRFHLESEFLIRCGWMDFKIAHIEIPTIYNNAPSAIRNLPDTLNFIAVILKLSMKRIRGHV